MNNAQTIAKEIDRVTEGFARVPVKARPPHVKWGEEFYSWDAAKQNLYLMKFSEAMNHAADLVQQERNQLGALLEKKEQQLLAMQSQVEANNNMLHSEVTRMNEDRQAYAANIAALNSRIKELEDGNIF